MAGRPWWRRGAIYEIYTRSFQDSNGDGTGDLDGITSRLEYLEWLGLDGIWLTPFYRSPMADFGYDVADHTDVDPLFGALASFDRLIDEAHRREIRVVVDYVPNHTSDRHPWFEESRASRTNPRRDWFFWREGRPDGSLPNNWLSLFGGPAWERDERTGQYYLHTFLREQPDLNWRNPAVREAMFDVARFWLRRGVDGFRIDVASGVMKDPALRDNPPTTVEHPGAWFGAEWMSQQHLHDFAHPDVYDVWRRFREVVDESAPGRDPVIIAEVPKEDLAAWARYYGEALDAVHLPFGFHLVRHDWRRSPRDLIDQVEAVLPAGAWPNWVLGNHDQPRIASWAGPERARAAMLLLLTLRGSPTIYYGDELGLTDVAIPPGRVRDPWEATEPGQGRDPARTPMPWDAGEHGGFCPEDVEPWLPLGPSGRGLDVASQMADPHSMLALTRRLLALRRERPALGEGTYRPLDGTPDGTFAFIREVPGERLAVALNLADRASQIELSEGGRILVSTTLARHGRTGRHLGLDPFEAVVVATGD